MTHALGRHAVALASVREVAARAGAQRVVLLVDEGEATPPTMVEWAEGGTFELTEGGVTEPIDPATLVTVVPAVKSTLRSSTEIRGWLLMPSLSPASHRRKRPARSRPWRG